MENPNKPKNLFLKFLPKVVNFQNPQFSPKRDHHHHHNFSGKLKAHAHKGFSGPINYSKLPEEARSKPNKDGSFEAHEPTSPKVSCMGQIKYKHRKNKLRKINSKRFITNFDQIKKNKSSMMIKLFRKSSKVDKKSKGSQSEEHGKITRGVVGDNNNNKRVSNIKPCLGQLKKFSSGRDSLANFDWTAQIAPIDQDYRDYYSDDDEERRRDNLDDDQDDDDEVIIPYSAPILLGGTSYDDHDGLKARKEVNIWKRRTMAPPPPLSLNSKARS
ncbi:unnamed protein product [Amaranthus hypochondriacus]